VRAYIHRDKCSYVYEYLRLYFVTYRKKNDGIHGKELISTHKVIQGAVDTVTHLLHVRRPTTVSIDNRVNLLGALIRLVFLRSIRMHVSLQRNTMERYLQ
jgi:hypothetical protein